jgi:hypothetical protein
VGERRHQRPGVRKVILGNNRADRGTRQKAASSTIGHHQASMRIPSSTRLCSRFALRFKSTALVIVVSSRLSRETFYADQQDRVSRGRADV